MRQQKKTTQNSKRNSYVAVHMPKSLFQRTFRESLPEINILTKTQLVLNSQPKASHIRNQSSVIPNRQSRAKGIQSYGLTRLYPLQQPQRNVSFRYPYQYQQTHHRLKELRRRMLLRKPQMIHHNSPSVIYKSEITVIYDNNQDSPATGYNGVHESVPTEEDAEEGQFRDTVKNGSHTPWAKPYYRRLPIAYTGEESQRWLQRIFGQEDFYDSYEDINRQLLRKDQLYKYKGLNLKVDKEWRY